ncbi:MAG: helix-turn-helix domain-containing protein [Succinivibrio sp.]|nr:helix-turn-helix domain-containing protein [Succinivibrio sp.]
MANKHREPSKVLDSYILHAYIFKPIVNELGFNAAVVYGRLFLFTHYGAISCTYDNSQIQLDLRCSKSTAIRTIDLLEKKGLIKIFLTTHNRQSIRNIKLNKNSSLFPYNYNESKNYTGCQKDTRGINLTLGGYQNDTGEGYQNDTHKQNINKQNINIEGEAARSPLPPLSSFVDSVQRFQNDKHERTEWDAQKAAEFIRDNCIAKKQQIDTQEELDAKIAIAMRSWKGLYAFMTPQAVRTRTAPKKKDAFASLDQRLTAAREMARKRKEKEACANAVEVTILENNHD